MFVSSDYNSELGNTIHLIRESINNVLIKRLCLWVLLTNLYINLINGEVTQR